MDVDVEGQRSVTEAEKSYFGDVCGMKSMERESNDNELQYMYGLVVC